MINYQKANILVFLFSFFFFTSCSNVHNKDTRSRAELSISPYNDYDLEQSADEPVYLNDNNYIYDSVYFTDNHAYGGDSSEKNELDLHLLIHNDTEYDVSGDFYFELEYLSDDNNWYTIPPKDYDFIEMAAIYPKEGEYKINYELSKIDHEFSKGTYRLIRKLRIDDLPGDCLAVYRFIL